METRLTASKNLGYSKKLIKVGVQSKSRLIRSVPVSNNDEQLLLLPAY